MAEPTGVAQPGFWQAGSNECPTATAGADNCLWASDAHNEDILFLYLQPNWKIPILQNNVRNGDIDNHTLASYFPLDSI